MTAADIMKRLTQCGEPWYAAFFLANLVMGTSSILVPLKLDRGLHLGPSQLGILSTLTSLGAVLGSLIWGRLSDVVHRRKLFVVLSYSFVSLTSVGLAFASTFHEMVLHNVIMNFFWIANASVAVLLVIERTDERFWESRISALNLSGAIGWLGGLLLGAFVVSPMLTSLSGSAGPRVTFLGLAGVAALSAVIAAWLLPSVVPLFTQRKFRGLMVAVGNLLLEAWRFNPLHLYHRFSLRRLRDLRGETLAFLAASALAFTGIGFFTVPLPLLLSQRLSYEPGSVFLSYVFLHLGIVLAYPFALQRIRRHGNRCAQIGALAARLLLFLVGALALRLWKSLPYAAVTGFLLLVGVTWSFFQLSGVALASRLAKPENRGLALGLYNAIAGGSTMLAGVTSGYLVQTEGYSASLAVGAGLLLTAVALLLRLREPGPLPSDAPQWGKSQLHKDVSSSVDEPLVETGRSDVRACAAQEGGHS